MNPRVLRLLNVKSGTLIHIIIILFSIKKCDKRGII